MRTKSELKKLEAVIHTIHPRRVFRISRGARTELENVFIRWTAGGITGYGEASPNAYYHETARDVVDKLEKVEPLLHDLEITTPASIADAWEAVWQVVAPSRAAQCAVDVALWDWLARKRRVSVAELALGRPPEPFISFCSVGISNPMELEEKVREVAGYPAIKVKSGVGASLEPVEFVRRYSGAEEIVVDANCGWSGEDIEAISHKLAQLGITFLEQPLPASEPMGDLVTRSAVPIIADESCVEREDVDAMPGRFSGFNIKLVKCGGLTPALAMLRRGRELGLKVMVGCMLESSLLIAAGAIIAQESDYADLDGAWLLADDPFVVEGSAAGIPLRNGMLQPGSGPGFDVRPVPGVFP